MKQPGEKPVPIWGCAQGATKVTIPRLNVALFLIRKGTGSPDALTANQKTARGGLTCSWGPLKPRLFSNTSHNNNKPSNPL